MFWVVEEAVGNGYCITHDGIYSTREAAEREAQRYRNARAAAYRRGGWGTGPQRIEEKIEEN